MTKKVFALIIHAHFHGKLDCVPLGPGIRIQQ